MEVEIEKVIKYSSEMAPSEKDNLDSDLINLPRSWTIWEGYEPFEEVNLEWNDSFKKLYNFKDIIGFWQFWNNTIYRNFEEIFFDGEKYNLFYKNRKRINSVNFFIDGVNPKWEDEKNKGGQILSIVYELKELKKIKEILQNMQKSWLELVLLILGESLDGSNYVNGIRVKDKTSINKRNLFIFEIWINKDITTENGLIDRMLNKLKEKFEGSIEVRKIK